MWLSLLICIASLVLLFNTVRNFLLFRRTFPQANKQPSVSVLIPARNEEDKIEILIESLQRQNYPNFNVFILDDDSADRTFAVTRNAIQDNPRFHVYKNTDPVPSGWLGKPLACQRLFELCDGELVCFIDADVRLEPNALSKSVDMLYGLNVDVLCPYPTQKTSTLLSRIVQPLLQWSWMASLPLDLALTSSRSSLVAGNGQLLIITREMYTQIGGHSSVQAEVLEDIELVRQVKRAGGHGGVWDGSDIAECSMYETNRELINGYAKSLWKAFGSIPRGLVVATVLLLLFLHPVVSLFSPTTSIQILAALSVVAAILSRLLVHHKFRYPLIDSVFYPLTFVALLILVITSGLRKRRGTLTWKTRNIHE